MKTRPDRFFNQTEPPFRLPRISIVTPCYNHAEFLEAAMLSILDQGYPRLEYIVMDGGSRDGSRQIIQRHEAHLAYWQSEPDRGQYHAVNEGFRHAGGDIMAWLNADDMLHRNALWSVAEIFSRCPEVCWLMGNPSWFDRSGRIVSTGQVPAWSRDRLVYGQWKWIQQESVFWRRSLWEQAGGRLETDYSLAADFELWVRFFRFTRLYTTPAPLAGFRVFSENQRGRRHREAYEREVGRIIERERKHFFKRSAWLKSRLTLALARYLPAGIKRFIEPFYRLPDPEPPMVLFDKRKSQFHIHPSNPLKT